MDLGLAGKVALVGGASRGLGRAAAERLAREGCSVALYARSREPLERAADEIGEETGTPTHAVRADVASAEDCERAVAETVRAFGGLDVLVTNTGPPAYGPALTRSDEDWQAAWERMALAVVRLCRLALPAMRDRGGGSIVNIFGCDLHQLVPHTASASITRLAAAGFSKYVATEAARDNVRSTTSSLAGSRRSGSAGSSRRRRASGTYAPRRSTRSRPRRCRWGVSERPTRSPTRSRSSPPNAPRTSRGRACASTGAGA